MTFNAVILSSNPAHLDFIYDGSTELNFWFAETPVNTWETAIVSIAGTMQEEDTYRSISGNSNSLVVRNQSCNIDDNVLHERQRKKAARRDKNYCKLIGHL